MTNPGWIGEYLGGNYDPAGYTNQPTCNKQKISWKLSRYEMHRVRVMGSMLNQFVFAKGNVVTKNQ